MPDLLLELFSEEIPARMQARAAEDLAHLLTAGMEACGLGWENSFDTYATPRRLAIHLHGIAASTLDSAAERKGPRVGAPEAAIQGFLKTTGMRFEQLTVRDGVYYAAIEQKGRPAAELLKDIVEKALRDLVWPKSMRWGDGAASWVRPLHSVLCVFDGKTIPVKFAGLEAGNVTHGHRFLHPHPVEITDPAYYTQALRHAKVIASREERKALIQQEAEKLAHAHGVTLRTDPALLEEVAGLVEWPVLLMGRIDAQFMDLPPEVLTSVMRGHQKYFSCKRHIESGELAPHFLIVSNMETADGGKAIAAGNERVLRARFSDARFFWDQDRKKTLAQWADGLQTVTYHTKIGTMAQKVERIKTLAVNIWDTALGKNGNPMVERAAALCKADLVTGMVGEFAELQGVMGRYYALGQGEAPEVADAIRDHYKPQGPNDTVPHAPVSVCVALADKLDTLAGMFAIGEKPSGSKDPFALRRAALGVIRIIVENNLRLPLASVIPTGVERDIMAFLLDRLKVQMKDLGIRHDIINAVTADGGDDPVRIVAKAKALQAFLFTGDGANLLAAYKRAANILSIEEKKDKTRYNQAADTALLALAEEKTLHGAMTSVFAAVPALLAREDFAAAMHALSALRQPVDRFFDEVLVNDKDPATRANRLRLLAQLRATLDSIADFAQIEDSN